MTSSELNPLYFRQILSGQDFAIGDPIATNMVNFCYLIGDRQSGECLVVDPAYAVGDLTTIAEQDDMKITGVLVSHYHADHIGGSMMGHTIEGITRLLEQGNIPIHVNQHEAAWIERTTGVSQNDLVKHDSGDVVRIGKIEISLLHTPGHTPGSQCFHVQNFLISGDTLFLDGCGRTDLPGSNPEQMYESLVSLSMLPDDTILFPGHRYSEPSYSYLGDVKANNYVFKPKTKDGWLSMFGHD